MVRLGMDYSAVRFCRIDQVFDMECDVLYADDEVVNNLYGNKLKLFNDLQTQLIKRGTKIIKAYQH